jgi:hypothetical protein
VQERSTFQANVLNWLVFLVSIRIFWEIFSAHTIGCLVCECHGSELYVGGLFFHAPPILSQWAIFCVEFKASGKGSRMAIAQATYDGSVMIHAT